ncbi:MAG TPA: PEP-CTERM sorting domain-containing protein [Phycisphaerales bacterium]|nr:PEP-CTERM sorting domain-containing protein [Phycisphaerales bacterium]
MTARLVAMGAIVCALGSAASADIVGISGSIGDSTEQTGATFSGSIDYTFNGGSNGTVVITLNNDTPPAVGGYLTGFVFNIDSIDPTVAAALSSATNANFLDTGNEAAPPFGNYLAGAALGADWTGGGSPNGGIPVGGSAMFTFAVTASDAGSLSASSFVNGPNEFDFVARFRGLSNGGSDKVPVPAPSAAALLGLGGLAAIRRRR